MQDQWASEKIWGITALQCYRKKKKKLKSCFVRWFSRKKKCTDKFQVKTGIWFYLYLQQIHRQYK